MLRPTPRPRLGTVVDTCRAGLAQPVAPLCYIPAPNFALVEVLGWSVYCGGPRLAPASMPGLGREPLRFRFNFEGCEGALAATFQVRASSGAGGDWIPFHCEGPGCTVRNWLYGMDVFRMVIGYVWNARRYNGRG